MASTPYPVRTSAGNTDEATSSPVGDAYFTFPKAIKKAAGRSMGMLQADDWTRAAPSLCSCTLIAGIFPYVMNKRVSQDHQGEAQEQASTVNVSKSPEQINR